MSPSTVSRDALGGQVPLSWHHVFKREPRDTQPRARNEIS